MVLEFRSLPTLGLSHLQHLRATNEGRQQFQFVREGYVMLMIKPVSLNHPLLRFRPMT